MPGIRGPDVGIVQIIQDDLLQPCTAVDKPLHGFDVFQFTKAGNIQCGCLAPIGIGKAVLEHFPHADSLREHIIGSLGPHADGGQLRTIPEHAGKRLCIRRFEIVHDDGFQIRFIREKVLNGIPTRCRAAGAGFPAIDRQVGHIHKFQIVSAFKEAKHLNASVCRNPIRIQI